MGFRVKIKKTHDAKGYASAYQVSKESGIAINTVRKYIADDEVRTKHIELPLVRLIDFYGLDWRDPDVIEVVDDEGKAKPPLAVAV